MFQRIKRKFNDPAPVPVPQKYRIAPFRSINDFILDARWDKPVHNDENRLNNRVINNLLYYQTNYLVLYITVTFLIG